MATPTHIYKSLYHTHQMDIGTDTTTTQQTHTKKQAKEYFSDLDTHRIDFEWTGELDGALRLRAVLF